jgi:hypothetical protein
MKLQIVWRKPTMYFPQKARFPWNFPDVLFADAQKLLGFTDAKQFEKYASQVGL